MVARLWSVSALAVELGLDRRTIAARLAEVAPAARAGRGPRYRLADVIPAIYGAPPGTPDAPAGPGPRLDRLNLTTESARLKRAQADKTELEVSVLRGELIPSETVSLVWSQFVSAARARVLAIPSTAAPRVVGLTVREAEIELREMVRAALAELQEYESSDYHKRNGIDSQGGAVDRTAAGNDTGAMGGRKPDSKPRGKRRTGPVVNR